jgi:delta-aminolevulinic acid dehydratase/porphobilinogen synthase
MIMARRTGWIDGDKTMMVRLIGFKHAGADMLRCAGGREAARSMRFRLPLF